jgi:hypothetical protein
MRATTLVLIWLLAGVASASAQTPEWTRYQLEGASVDLPLSVFPIDSGPTPQGSGRVLKTVDNRADVSLYSIANQPRRSPATFLRDTFQLPPSAAIYRRVTGDMLAVSGYRGDQIWYARCNFGATRLNCVSLNYPANEKRAWDSIVTRISHSLSRPG